MYVWWYLNTYYVAAVDIVTRINYQTLVTYIMLIIMEATASLNETISAQENMADT